MTRVIAKTAFWGTGKARDDKENDCRQQNFSTKVEKLKSLIISEIEDAQKHEPQFNIDSLLVEVMEQVKGEMNKKRQIDAVRVKPALAS